MITILILRYSVIGLKSRVWLKTELSIFFPKHPSLVFLISVNDTTILSVTQARNLGFPYLPIILQSLSCVDIITLTFLKSMPFSLSTQLLPQLRLSASLAQTVAFILSSAARVTSSDLLFSAWPAKPLAVSGIHHMLLNCQTFTHVVSSV